MKTITQINDKEIAKRVDKERFYNISDFAEDCKRYAKALKERRLIVSIVSVSASGMSRTIKVREIAKGNDGNFCLNSFYSLFKSLGITLNKDGNVIMKGCGMDMVFALNYSICGDLHQLGVLNKDECQKLSQRYINRF